MLSLSPNTLTASEAKQTPTDSTRRMKLRLNGERVDPLVNSITEDTARAIMATIVVYSHFKKNPINFGLEITLALLVHLYFYDYLFVILNLF